MLLIFFLLFKLIFAGNNKQEGLELIGEGAVGNIYSYLNPKFAQKGPNGEEAVLKQSKGMFEKDLGPLEPIKQLRNEHYLLKLLERNPHPNVMRFYGTDNHYGGLVLEKIKGPTLASAKYSLAELFLFDKMKFKELFKIRNGRYITLMSKAYKEINAALSHIHSKKLLIWHNDLHSNNIMFTVPINDLMSYVKDGTEFKALLQEHEPLIKIIDFGKSKQYSVLFCNSGHNPPEVREFLPETFIISGKAITIGPGKS